MIHPGHIDGILDHMRCSSPTMEAGTHPRGNYMLDPYCGDGSAAEQIAATLGMDGVYGIEQTKDLGQIAQEVLLGGNVLTPCTPRNALITGRSFGLVFAAPPKPSELGGQKFDAADFVQRMTPLLAPHGVLVMFCPFVAFIKAGALKGMVDSLYDNVSLYRVPEGEYSSYVVMFGSKRPEPLDPALAARVGALSGMGLPHYCTSSILAPLGGVQPKSWRYGNPVGKEDAVRTWLVPLTTKPHTFKKIGYTLEEKAEMLANSPLNTHFETVPPRRVYEPPLALGRGHVALLLAAGILDGRVVGPDGIPHVVRGSSFKARYQDHKATRRSVVLETGVTTIKERFGETPVTVIRCAMALPTPCIKTFSNQPQEISSNA